MNHVLLAACRDNQTAADARIEGQFTGAFTHYLCKIIRDAGASLDQQSLITQLRGALSDNEFEQVPQLEPANSSGPLFFGGRANPSQVGTGGGGGSGSGGGSDAGPGSTSGGSNAALVEFLDNVLKQRPPEDFSRVLKLLESQSVAGSASSRSVTPGRHLLNIHGICKHDNGFSDSWWEALRPHTSAFGAGNRDETRHEVVWSDIVNKRSLQPTRSALRSGATRDVTAIERVEVAAEIRGVLEERLARHVARGAPRMLSPTSRSTLPRDPNMSRGLSIPGLNCADDFTSYLLDRSTRDQILARFVAKWKALQEATEIDLITHSWGTVVGYEGLRMMERQGLSIRVRNFFTVGSALSIAPVKRLLLNENRDGKKPAMVKRWINIDARGDIVGGRLQGEPFEVDVEILDLVPWGCDAFLGLVGPGCSHSSYFVAGNVAVNRDIFAAFIDQA